MRKILILLLIFTYSTSFSAVRTTVKNGNWNDPCTWSLTCTAGSVPAINDIITINHTVTMNVDVTVTNGGTLTISSSGNLIDDGNLRLLTIGDGSGSAPQGTFTVNGHATIGTLYSEKSNIVIGSNGMTINCKLSTVNNTQVTISGPMIIKGGWLLNQGNITASGSGSVEVWGCADGSNGSWNGVTVLYCIRDTQGIVSSACNVPCGNINAITNATNCKNVVFPVEWLDINISNPKNNFQLQLDWILGFENNNTGFWIQSSEDGITFKNIKYESSLGNTNQVRKYSKIIDNDGSAYKYFRIQQIDYDGRTSYSSIIHYNSNNVDVIFNYNTNNKILKIETSDTNYNGFIINSIGQTIFCFQSSESYFETSLDYLNPGFYTLQIVNSNGLLINKKILVN